MRTVLTVLTLSIVWAIPTTSFANPADVLAANQTATGGSAWTGKETLKADYGYSGQGLTGNVHSLTDLRNGRFVDSFAAGPITQANGFDGTTPWAKDPSGTATAQEGGDNLALAINEAYRRSNRWWRSDRGGAQIADDGLKSDGGETYDVLTVTPRGGKPFDAWFDEKSHLLSRTVEQQGTMTITTSLSGYRAFDGVMLAGRTIVNQGDHKYDQTVLLQGAVFLPAQEASQFAMPKIAVADFAIAGDAKETTFPFDLINNHIYAKVFVNGKGPYVFIFDTGGVNLLTPPLAQELGLKTDGKFQANGAGSGHMEAGFTRVDSLQLGDASVRNQVFTVLPLNEMSNIEGLQEVGMVGFETFRRFVTRIDYGAHTITLVKPGDFDPKDAGTAIPVVFNGNGVEVHGSYNGAAGIFDIDTGSRASLTLNGPFAAANNIRPAQGKSVEGVTGWGVGGPSRGYAMRGGTLMMGSVAVSGAVVELSTDKGGAFSDASTAGNIGAGILKRFIVTFDYEHKKMYLKPVTTPVADLDTFDRAGLWINASTNGFKVVDVTAHTPAEDAGLKADDEIVAVDGTDAKSITLSDMRAMLRDKPAGSIMKLTVQRDRERKTIAITLRDLI
ncbi:MAG: aspartyl protease family protein [Rhizomicrobium sp.]|jgi:membrane-associated protease RseP (regulator of RpoE activity)